MQGEPGERELPLSSSVIRAVSAGLSRREFCALSLLWAWGCSSDATRSAENRRIEHSRAGPSRPRARAVDPFQPDPELFESKRPPRPGDWLDRFPERPQSFAQYAASSPPGRTAARNKIVLQPLGRFDGAARELFGKVREHAALFFGVPVALADAIPLPLNGRRQRREDGRRWTQHRTTVIESETLLPRLPADAITYLGVTLADLYPEPSWNFVFGEASLEERVGVYSFARFYPEFTGEKPSAESPSKLLRRALHILSHETCHMFGLVHCTEFECLMNGSNSLDELDRQRAELCPICLRKLAHNLEFDVVRRYAALAAFYRRNRLTDLAEFSQRRFTKLTQKL
jgi:archaemetzincin